MPGNTELPLAQAAAPPGEDRAPDAGNQWWRNLAFVLVLVLLARFSLYFLTLVGMVIFFSDQRRNRYTRLGGTILMAWWLLTWSWSAAPPIIAAGLLVAAAVAFVAAVRSEQHRRWAATRNAALAVVAGLLAVLNFVPWGLREPVVDRGEALQIALANRRGTVVPTDAQIVPTRERFTQRPVYAVLLFERNGDKLTADREPCFRRLDTHIVDGITGAADPSSAAQWITLDPLLDPTADEVAEARERDGFCLRVPRGISTQVVPVAPPP